MEESDSLNSHQLVSSPDPVQQLLLVTEQITPAGPMQMETLHSVVEPGTTTVPDPGGGTTRGDSSGIGSSISDGRLVGGSRGQERENSSRQSASAPACTPTSFSIATPSSSQLTSGTHQVRREEAQQERMNDLDLSSLDGNISPDDLEGSYLHDDLSPEPYCTSSPGPGGVGRIYKCRFCSFSTATYTHLQLHMNKHSGHRTLKCALCDYRTNDKSNFRRHKRLHVRTNPAPLLRCDKCSYSTPISRKMREHYSHAHNEDYGPSLISTSTMHLRSSAYNTGPYGGLPHVNNLCSTSGSSGNGGGMQLAGSNASFHSFLAQPHGTIQFARGNPPHLIANCVNGGFAAASNGGQQFDDGRQILMREDNRMASDCLRSIMSNIISHPRVPATSTITSSNFYLSASAAPQPPCNISPPSTHHPQSHHTQQLHHLPTSIRRAPLAMHHPDEVKVKVEPIDCDGISDVSSSGASILYDRERERERERLHRYMEPQVTSLSQQRLTHEPGSLRNGGPLDQSDEIAPSGETYRVTQSSEAASSRNVGGNGSAGETERADRSIVVAGDSVRPIFSIKSEVSNVGVQCSFAVKSESSHSVSGSSTEHGSEWRRLRYLVIERGVQCELLSSTSPRHLTSRTLSADSEQQSVTGSETRCSHCGITFDDEVLFTIHIGCHSHTDPFVCNVCGKKCYSKYGFYSHIMRGHHF